MRIPRQSDGSGARVENPDDVAGLRARRRHLIAQLRAVGYWQRLVQARTDLSVAGLLYCAPVPGGVVGPGWVGTPFGDEADTADVSGLGTPPEGLDVPRLLGEPVPDGPGAQLDRLRQVAIGLACRNRTVREELDVVTTALHAQLARDGAATPPAASSTTARSGSAVGTSIGSAVTSTIPSSGCPSAVAQRPGGVPAVAPGARDAGRVRIGAQARDPA